MPDPKKGERLILVTDRAGAEPGPLVAHAQSIHVSSACTSAGLGFMITWYW